jgi:hypothetical protein
MNGYGAAHAAKPKSLNGPKTVKIFDLKRILWPAADAPAKEEGGKTTQGKRPWRFDDL